MTGQDTRNKLTDYWSAHDIKKGSEFAVLTNIIHQEWSGVSVLCTRQIADCVDATGMAENKTAAQAGGRIARQARNQLESQTGTSIVSSQSFLPDAPKKIAKKLANTGAKR